MHDRPESTELIATWKDCNMSAEDSPLNDSVAAHFYTGSITKETPTQGAQHGEASGIGAGTTSRSANIRLKGKKMPSTNFFFLSFYFEELLSLHEQAGEPGEKGEKKSYELEKELVQIQAESNDIQASMVRVTEPFLGAKAIKRLSTDHNLESLII